MAKNIHETIADIVIKQLEDGVVPWLQDGFAKKWNYSGIPYGGVNLLLLPKEGVYLTLSQIKMANGSLKENAKPYDVVISKPRWVDPTGNAYLQSDFENGYPTRQQIYELDLKRDDIVKFGKVYHIDDTTIKEKPNFTLPFVDMSSMGVLGDIYKCEHGVMYDPETDRAEADGTPFNVYRVAIHKTGYRKRLHRAISRIDGYSKEHLVGCIGASILIEMARGEKPNPTPEEIDEWIRVFKSRPSIIYTAATSAWDAVMYILKLIKQNLGVEYVQTYNQKGNGESTNLRSGIRTGESDNLHSNREHSSLSSVVCRMPLFYEVVSAVIGYIVSLFIIYPTVEIVNAIYGELLEIIFG